MEHFERTGALFLGISLSLHLKSEREGLERIWGDAAFL